MSNNISCVLRNFFVFSTLSVWNLTVISNSFAYDQPRNKVVPVKSATEIKLSNGTGDPVAGKAKSELCQGCHGEAGISVEPLIPKLAGQFSKYISKQLHDYQSHTRTHQIMNAMASTINDEDMVDISAYFSGLSRMKGEGQENPEGKNIFLNGNSSRTLIACVRCHGVNGKGLTPTTALFPVIGGQNKEYLRKQLIDFRDGNRTNSPGGIMNKITQSLTNAEIEVLTDYLAAL